MPKPSKEELESFYWGKKLSLWKLANHFGVSAQTILNWFRGYGIPTRSRSEAGKAKTWTKEHIRRLRESVIGGEKHYRWKPDGSKYFSSEGYVFIKRAGHPRGNWVFEHVLIMEQHLGRLLREKEEVHHVNGIKSDNRLENLELFTSHSEHLETYNHRRKDEWA